MEKEDHSQQQQHSVTLTEKTTEVAVMEDQKIQVASESTPNPSSTEITTTVTETTTKADERSDKKKTFYRVMTFIALQVTLFLGALDGTIVSTILPHVGSEFNQMSIVAWIATAYILTFDAFQPLFAKFSDIFGRKWTLITGISIFLFGSLLCGVATSMIMLIVFRAVAGIGAAGVFSGVFIIISEIVPLEKRGSYQGIINAVFAVSSVFGPLIGGGFTDNISWRWCFYINLPIGGVAIVLLIFFLDLPTPKTTFADKLKRIDYAGTVIVLVAAILFLLAMNFGGELYPWKSAAVIVPLVFSFLFAGVFAYVESKFAKEPIVPPRLFKNRSVVGILFTNWWFGVSFFSLVYYLPIYFQVVKGDSAMWSGIRLIPMQLVICAASVTTGLLISKFQLYRPFIWIGTCLLTLHIGLVSLFDVDTGFPMIYGITVIGGVGMGLMFSSTIIAIQAAVEPKDIAVVTGLGNFARLLGAAVGVSISSSILNSELKDNLPTVLPAEYAEIIMKQALFIYNGLPEEYKAPTIQVYCDAIRLIWYVVTPLTALSIIGGALVKHYNLRKPGQRNKKPDQEKAKEDTTTTDNHDEKIQIDDDDDDNKKEIVINVNESSSSSTSNNDASSNKDHHEKKISESK
ncbi:unnamed protein product [Cunninghamella blakesleeana]